MPAAIMECGDFKDFQDALREMRRVDDIIVNTINAVIPTDSFHPDPKASCRNLHEQIESGNQKREAAIKNCITISADKVKKLKEQREKNLSDIQLSKDLRAEQTKVRRTLT
ncbi:coiled-coil domain-containing protein 58 [Holotrichia oblita]|uniref:Coiled-coil domain-containing protein 58 n=1 Tax=Holotrichia oblita TaxID=644536 RepID=A0ACB9SUX3_HOLOL|nr:coiled-coil domain-containing protein 58 [Holotrichia oblita]